MRHLQHSTTLHIYLSLARSPRRFSLSLSAVIHRCHCVRPWLSLSSSHSALLHRTICERTCATVFVFLWLWLALYFILISWKSKADAKLLFVSFAMFGKKGSHTGHMPYPCWFTFTKWNAINLFPVQITVETFLILLLRFRFRFFFIRFSVRCSELRLCIVCVVYLFLIQTRTMRLGSAHRRQ